MSTLTTASRQWASRPADERYTSLINMQDHFRTIRQQSREVVAPAKRIHAAPSADNRGLVIVGPGGNEFAPTNWAFGQVCSLASAPAAYLRSLPAAIAADALNYGLQHETGAREEAQFLLQRNGSSILRAVTGPRYGRIWNAEVVDGLVSRFGDGVSGDFRVPGEFGRAVTVTKDNTTLYASDRDMFVFLADEQHKIEVPNRRNGETGLMSRGFFVWNSEVGAQTLGIATFLFDYVCSNRIVWGASEYKEIRVRHSSGAPDRFIGEIYPQIENYAQSSTKAITATIGAAMHARLDDDRRDKLLIDQFGKRVSEGIKMAHEFDEGRPIETLWDIVTGATAYARDIANQDARVEFERKAGEILDLVAA